MRVVGLWLGAAGLVLGLVVASLVLGAADVSVGAGLAGLVGRGDSMVQTLMLQVRVPRTVLAVVVGAGLGLAGSLTQAHTRNPMADPGLLGVTAGAAAGVVLVIAVFGWVQPGQYIFGGLVGGLVAAAVVLVSARAVRFLSPVLSLVLVGAAFSAFLGAVTTATVLLNEQSLNAFRFWGTGVLSGQGWPVVWVAVPVFLVGLGLAGLNLSALGPAVLGDVSAVALGRNVVRDRLVGLAAVAVLASAATVAAGSIAFVGLLAPHAAVRLVPGSQVAAAGFSAVVGVVLVLAADVVGRLVFATSELAVGVVLALVGAPVFVLLARSRRFS